MLIVNRKSLKSYKLGSEKCQMASPLRDIVGWSAVRGMKKDEEEEEEVEGRSRDDDDENPTGFNRIGTFIRTQK